MVESPNEASLHCALLLKHFYLRAYWVVLRMTLALQTLKLLLTQIRNTYRTVELGLGYSGYLWTHEGGILSRLLLGELIMNSRHSFLPRTGCCTTHSRSQHLHVYL